MGTFFGVDLGRRHDSTAIVVVEQDAQGGVVVRAIRELRGVPFDAQVAEVLRLAERFAPVRIAVDETGLGIPVVERLRAKLGHRVEGVTFTAASKAELVARTVVLLQDRRLRFGIHPRLREELHSITREVTSDGRILYRVSSAGFDTTGEHHADLAWALLLAVHGIPAFRGKPGPVAFPNPARLAESRPAQRPRLPPREQMARIRMCTACGRPVVPGQEFLGAAALRHAKCPGNDQ